MKRLLSFLLLIACCLPLQAQRRAFAQAKVVADNALRRAKSIQNNSQCAVKALVNTPSSVKKIVGTEEDTAPFYIFTDSVKKTSFIIVSGDERMRPVLAYGDNGVWKEDSIPDGVLYMLEYYSSQYESLQNGNITKRAERVSIQVPTVVPMIKTTWSQDAPYNNLCPSSCPSGCVATAMSQVMKYHQYPAQGKGTFSYTSHTRRYRCSYDFANANFDWGGMSNAYSSSSSYAATTDAIAQATYACGVSVGMDYAPSGSGAYMADVPYALINFFGYNENVSYRDRAYYDAKEWYQVLCDELSSGRPVIYGGVDSKNGGHAFVIDGCSAEDGKFHVNWGWAGAYDGYYELDALDPQVYEFSSYQSMIVNVSPETVGSFGDEFYAGKFTVSSKISAGANVVFTITDAYCFASQSSYAVSSAKYYGRIGVGIFDADFKFIRSIDSDSIEGINNFYGYSKLTYASTISNSMFPQNGTYYIAPYVMGSASVNPTRIRTSGGDEDYIIVTLNGDDITSTGEHEEPVEILSDWEEDFESMKIPSSWKQEVELGTSKWKQQYVLMASDEVPPAAHGKGYVSLAYGVGMDLYNSRTVVRLISDVISLENDGDYNLSFQTRKLSKQAETTDIITVLYRNGEDWTTLTAVDVINQSDWNQTVVELPTTGNIQLAFEGSPSRDSSVLLDDIRIYKRGSETGIKKQIAKRADRTAYGIYNMSGALVASTKGKVPDTAKLLPGVYILRCPVKTYKIYVK